MAKVENETQRPKIGEQQKQNLNFFVFFYKIVCDLANVESWLQHGIFPWIVCSMA
jgi:hypothetical protein